MKRFSLSNRFMFNRFQDEIYLFDTTLQDYCIYEGIAGDLVHILKMTSVTVDELHALGNRIIAPEILLREQVEDFVQRLFQKGEIVLTSEMPEEPDKVFNHIYETRNLPFFYAPLAVNLFINGKCNQKCDFCFLDFDMMDQDHAQRLSTAEWLTATEKLIDAGIHTINIGGMEPLISFDLSMDILEYAKQRGCIIGMITNGTIPLKDEQLTRLKDVDPMVGISLQHHDPTIHDKMAVLNNAFDKCVRNLKKMMEYEINIGVQSVAARDNTDTMEDFIYWLEEMGVTSFNMQNIFGGPWCQHTDFFSTALRPEEFKDVQQRLYSIQKDVSVEIQMDAFPHERPDDYNTSQLKGIKFRTFSTCSAGKTAIQVSPSGDVSPCPFTVALPDHKLGNLLEEDVLDIWHNTALFGPFRKYMREDYKSSACQNCEVFDICRGGCLITANAANAGYLNGDPRCSKVQDALQMATETLTSLKDDHNGEGGIIRQFNVVS